eukprot:m.327093 g.327093  ORF g.327093 m.327093 type:complete len:201 (+) comp16022_c1_seq34:1282-1884(+)
MTSQLVDPPHFVDIRLRETNLVVSDTIVCKVSAASEQDQRNLEEYVAEGNWVFQVPRVASRRREPDCSVPGSCITVEARVFTEEKAIEAARAKFVDMLEEGASEEEANAAAQEEYAQNGGMSSPSQALSTALPSVQYNENRDFRAAAVPVVIAILCVLLSLIICSVISYKMNELVYKPEQKDRQRFETEMVNPTYGDMST